MAHAAPVVFVALPAVEAKFVLPFVLVGQERAGTSVLQTALCEHPQSYCHADLLHADDRVRRRVHERYFGPEADPELWPDYCAQVQPDRSRGNPERYLDNRVFGSALRGESAVGAKLLYPHIWHSGLWEWLAGRANGPFAVIHVVRNPLACFVSSLQAAASKVRYWREGAARPRYVPSAVHLDLDAFVPYARQHEADAQRVRNTAPSALTVAYSDLACRPGEVLRRVFSYLELPHCAPARPTVNRLPNRVLRGRVANFEKARRAAPAGLRRYFETDMI